MQIRRDSLSICVILLLVNLLFNFVYTVNTDFFQLYVYLLCSLINVAYCYCYYIILHEKGFYSLQSFFWISLWAFGLSRFTFYILDIADFMNYPYSIIGVFHWTEPVTILIMNYYLIFIIMFTFVGTASLNKQNKNYLSATYKDTLVTSSLFKNVKKQLYFFFYASAPFAAAFYIMQTLVIRSVGYTSVFTHAASYNNFLLTIFVYIFNICFMLLCTFRDTKIKFTKISILYFIITSIQLLQGSRGRVIITGMVLLLLNYKLYGSKIKVRWLILFSILGIPVLVAMFYIRNGLAFSPNSIVRVYEEFFLGLSSSLNVPVLYLQVRESLESNAYPYILDPIVRIWQVFTHFDIYQHGQTLEMLNIRYNLAHHLTNAISTSFYLAGNGLGNNFIAEMAEFGFGGVVVLSAFFSWMCNWIDDNIISKPWLRYMSFQILAQIIFAVRGEFFYDTYNFVKYMFIYLLLERIIKFIVTNKTKKEINNI